VPGRYTHQQTWMTSRSRATMYLVPNEIHRSVLGHDAANAFES
jgi:hypothetical protein